MLRALERLPQSAGWEGRRGEAGGRKTLQKMTAVSKGEDKALEGKSCDIRRRFRGEMVDGNVSLDMRGRLKEERRDGSFVQPGKWRSHQDTIDAGLPRDRNKSVTCFFQANRTLLCSSRCQLKAGQ